MREYGNNNIILLAPRIKILLNNPDAEISNLTFKLVCDAQWQYISVNS